MERILGLDYGSVTVGAARNDDLNVTVQPLLTITRTKESRLRHTCARIEELIAEYQITELVVGLPLNMDGTEGERAKKARQFGQMLEKRTGLPVFYQDERLTTVEAEEILSESGVPREDWKKQVDALSAVLILEDFLSNHGGPEEEEG